MKILKLALKIALYLTILSLIAVITLIAYYFSVNKNVNLNDNKLKLQAINYEYYDGNNNLISNASILTDNDVISIDKLNSYTINAFISVEDKRFFNHKGVDYKRILGAIINNFKSVSLKEGASTISQQLIKNTHLSSEKTLKRKFNEIHLTFQLENKYNKKQILEKYLNTIYFGGGAYGINNASKLYFNKTADKLTVNESAMLAGIIKAPSYYSPISNYENSINRKNLVLKLMYNENYITKSEFEKYSKINPCIKSIESGYLHSYIKAVNTELENLVNFNPYTQNKTVKIYTYLDQNLQKHVYETNVLDIENIDRQQIVINNKNNGIIAFYGENSNLKRSPASCIKPWYIYAPMINDKVITESSIIIDEPTNFNGYKPSNYGDKYYGAVTVKTSLSKSLNVPSVKLLSSYDFKILNNYARKMGVNVNDNNLSIALGAIENGITINQLADCYKVFANNGNYVKSNFIKEVKIDNTTVYTNNNGVVNVFDSGTCFIMNDILKETVNSGTARKLSGYNYDLCAKTGTNGNDKGNIDAYTVAYTTEHTIATWLGRYDNSIFSNKISGGNYPALYTKSCLDYLYKNHNPNNFIMPSNVIKANIDVNSLYNEQITLLNDDILNSQPFYYLIGTEPTETINKNLNSKITYVNINLENNNLKLIINFENADGFEIKRIYNGIETSIYNGNSLEFIDTNLKNGKYYYKIIPYKYQNNQIIYGEEYILPEIKVSSESKIISNDWWND